MRALVTGGRGGIGAAIAAALGDAEVAALDLPEFDVGDPAAWQALDGPFDAAFLNAGVVTGETDVAALTDEQYRRAVRANVDGVVLGVRECAARLMPDGGSIVATASLAGLTATPIDPIYALTKHAVVGFVRSVAPQLEERGIRINALCPGFTDTPIVADEIRGELPAPLMEPSFVAGAALEALRSESSGKAWVVQPNRVVQFRFPNLPGPRQVARARSWGSDPPPAPHIWRTLGYRGVEQADGRSVIEWDATPDYCFHAPSGPIVHGGMVTTLLDTAMGGAMWSLLAEDESFLTADLHVDFLRSARPGTLRAEGRVIQRNRRVAFCAADLVDAEGTLLASSRCTQVIRAGAAHP